MKLLKILLVLIFLVFPFGQLTQLPVFYPGINIYLQDILVASLVISWLILIFFKKMPLFTPVFSRDIFLFSGIGVISLLFNFFNLEFKEMLISSAYLLRWIFYAGVYFIIYHILIFEKKWKGRIKWGLFFGGTVAAFFGFVQYFLYPDLRNLIYLGWDPHKYRIFGTFFDPGFLGIILVLTLVLFLDLVWDVWKKSKTIKKIGIILIWVFIYITLALTYSRSSYLAFLLGVAVYAFLKKTSKLFLVVLLIFLLTILVLPRPLESEGIRLERQESILGRIRSWKQAVMIAKGKPIFGVGFNSYRFAQKKYGFLSDEDWEKSHGGAGSDSSLLFVLATTGILGLGAYILLLYHILMSNIKIPLIFSSLVSLFIHSWFLNSLFYPWIMLWMWILVGSLSPMSQKLKIKDLK